jgi:lipid II:glycine glycyltransferase (peptidoglycan interpeptide bridge formation enzyme)
MTEVQQSDSYARYILLLKWTVEKIDGSYIFIKHIPFLGVIAKIHRPNKLPDLRKLAELFERYHVRTVTVEPIHSQPATSFNTWLLGLSKFVRINQSTFLPTKTLRVDITPPEEKIFRQFSEAKQRGVRRALKHGVVVKESTNISDLIRIKNKSSGVFGFITTTGIQHLWNSFAPKNAAILLAYTDVDKTNLVGGVLLIFWEKLAYYWIAGATARGKKVFSPTLLVWEAMKLSKKRGNKQFDLVGMWDERTPKLNTEWHGFTKFKEGFGGTPIYYPIATLHK